MLHLIINLLFFSTNALAAIYGEMNLVDIYKTSPEIQKLAKSTAVMMKWTYYDEKEDRFVSHLNPNIEQFGPWNGLKKKQLYYSQPSNGHCSGVLVAKNIILTAYHCTEEKDFIKNYFVAFDYQVSSDQQKTFEHLKKNVYRIKRFQKVTDSSDGIVAVELMEDVVDREPVQIAKDLAIEGNEIFSIHYPKGLPAKYSDGGTVQLRYKSEGYGGQSFTHNLDMFRGSSGAPIFDLKSKKLIGLEMAGEDDFRRQLWVFRKKYKYYDLQSTKKFELAKEIDAFTLDFLTKLSP